MFTKKTALFLVRNKNRLFAFLFILVAAALVFQTTAFHAWFYGKEYPEATGVWKEMRSTPGLWLDKEAGFSVFIDDAKQGKVVSIGVAQDGILVSTATGKYFVPDTFGGILAQSTLAMVREGTLPPFSIFQLSEARPKTGAANSLSSFFGLFLKIIGPVSMLALVGFVVFSMYPALSGGYKFVKSNHSFDDVIGAASAKDALQDIVAYLRNPKAFEMVGARPPKGVLMTGNPGTGKTLLAKALAGESGVSFISISGSDFSSQFFGVAIQKVKSLFEKARSHSPVIIFIDEVDGLGARSHATGQPGEGESNRIINQLLVEMDGFNATDHVVVVAATNFPEAIDPALLREGRFDRQVHINLPDVAEREQIFRLYSKEMPLKTDVDFYRLARMTTGLSPAAIAAVVNQAAILAATGNEFSVGQNHLLEAIEVSRIGAISGGLMVMTDADRRHIAVHEAGHALIAYLLKIGTLEKVTILPRGKSLGITVVTQSQDRHLMTKSEISKRIQMLLAGRCAEMLVLGDISTGAANDLEEATKFAVAMVDDFGFGKSGRLISGKAFASGRGLVDKTSVIDEAGAMLLAYESETMNMIEQHRASLEAVADALEAHEEIDGSLAVKLITTHLVSIEAQLT